MAVIHLLLRIYLQWVDERYIEGNEHRATNCTSNHVVWQEVEPHFWLPKLDVEDAIKLVTCHMI